MVYAKHWFSKFRTVGLRSIRSTCKYLRLKSDNYDGAKRGTCVYFIWQKANFGIVDWLRS